MAPTGLIEAWQKCPWGGQIRAALQTDLAVYSPSSLGDPFSQFLHVSVPIVTGITLDRCWSLRMENQMPLFTGRYKKGRERKKKPVNGIQAAKDPSGSEGMG